MKNAEEEEENIAEDDLENALELEQHDVKDGGRLGCWLEKQFLPFYTK